MTIAVNRSGIKIRIPASISDFGIGHRQAAACVEWPSDEIIVHLDESSVPGVKIAEITGKKTGIPLDPTANSAAIAAQILLDQLGEKRGINMRIHKNIPAGSGLSANAASAVGGVFALNELLGRPLERYDLLPIAYQAARHFDSAPFPAQSCSILFGGILFYPEPDTGLFKKVYTPKGLHITLVIPSLEGTPFKKIPANDFLHDSHQLPFVGKSCSMISALYESDFELLSQALDENPLEKPYSHYYPWLMDIRKIVRESGSYGFQLAGRGPGLFVVSPNTLIAGNAEEKIKGVFNALTLPCEIIQTKIDLNGVSVC